MADINIQGIDQTTGKLRPVSGADTLVTASGEVILGVTGIRGSTGLSGATGPQGAQGATGLIGATGVRGLTGTRGVTGPQVQGATGLMGATGTDIGVTGTFGVTGSQGYGIYALLAGATTLTASVQVVGCDTTTSFTVTLPAAATAGVGKEYIIYDEIGNAATNNITIARSGSDTINGQTTYLLDANFELVKLYSSGTNYYLRSLKGVTGIQGATGVATQGATGIQGATGVA